MDQFLGSRSNGFRGRLARWLSPDPAGLAAVNPADPFSWNRYTYVENTPLGSIDPLGLDCDPNNWGEAIPGTGGCLNAGPQVVNVYGTWPPDIALTGGLGVGAPDNIASAGLIFGRTPSVDTGGNGNGPAVAADQGPPNRLSWWQTLLSPVHNFNDPRPDCAVVSLEAIGKHLAGDFGFGPPGADASAGLAAGAEIQAERASAYAVGKKLIVPLRSSVYRGMMGTAETLSDISVVAAFLPIWKASVEATIDSSQAALSGACQ